MNFEKDENFSQNMRQLVLLLKKILKNLPTNHETLSQLAPLLKDTGINLNLYFFTFLPLAPEDMDELEDFYDPFWHEGKAEDLSGELNQDDLEFLRRNGIRF